MEDIVTHTISSVCGTPEYTRSPEPSMVGGLVCHTHTRHTHTSNEVAERTSATVSFWHRAIAGRNTREELIRVVACFTPYDVLRTRYELLR